jgi:hypothetical protein
VKAATTLLEGGVGPSLATGTKRCRSSPPPVSCRVEIYPYEGDGVGGEPPPFAPLAEAWEVGPPSPFVKCMRGWVSNPLLPLMFNRTGGVEFHPALRGTPAACGGGQSFILFALCEGGHWRWGRGTHFQWKGGLQFIYLFLNPFYE